MECRRASSPWTRSCERRKADDGNGSKGNNQGVKMQGRILFKQSKRVNNAVGRKVAEDIVAPPQQTHTRMNFRSNVAGIVKLVREANLRDAHLKQLRKTPFWIMIETIHMNNLNHNEFRKCDDLISKIIRSYNQRDNAFNIGGVSVKFGSSDIRLIFGLQCGKRRLDLSPGQRPVSDFIQRRCRDTSRLTLKLVKKLFLEALNGQKKQGEEDTAKLLGLYMCGKLFFSNSGETISWAFVRYMNDLSTVRMYDWIGAILTTLMASIKEFHRTPGKVTGCVVALLYWFCEHSNIVEPQTDNMFPRFLKWDIGALMNKIQGVDLAGLIGFQVKVDRLRSFDYEREVMGTDIQTEEEGLADINSGGEDCDGVDEHFMAEGTGKNASADQVVQGRNIAVKWFTEHVDRNSGIERDNNHKLEEALIAVAELEMQNKKKDKMVSSLEEEVVGLKRKMELQAVNIVGGFEYVVKMKNDELSKLKNENEELRKRVLVLEDQLEDRDVHDVTQRFWEGVDIGSSGVVNVGNDGCDGVMFCDVSPLRILPQYGRSGDEGGVDNVAECRPGMLRGHYGSSSSAAEAEGLTSDVECVAGLGYVNSYVRKIKNKVRRERKMPEFDYPLLGGCT
ncbi:unnamed protein product [Camellia sinensis]